MSGICGVIRFDGEAVSPQLLQRLTRSLAFRGPDAQEVWCDGNAGLGHALLRTTHAREKQPLGHDGLVWITADARIDAQAVLKDQLAAAGRPTADDASDSELILQAYLAWGEDCVTHLLGDFAFAIWDQRSSRLFCARDHFGVKPFFYANLGRQFVFSNTLECLRTHPDMPSTLDELAIGDFLIFERNLDPAGSAFRAIRRLPPAHRMSCSVQGVTTQKYWELDPQSVVRYRDERDYVQHFRELLGVAVSDRLRSDRISVEMSGGLDSTSVAAAAKRELDLQGNGAEVRALTVVSNERTPDLEESYARMVAEHLGISMKVVRAEAHGLYAFQRKSHPPLGEPLHDPFLSLRFEMSRQAAAFGRIALTGWDGDALLCESPKPYLRSLVEDGHYLRFAWKASQYALAQRRLIPHSLRDWLRRQSPRPPAVLCPYPAWIDPAFEARHDLRTRWRQHLDSHDHVHRVRPYSYGIYDDVMRYSNFFDRYDPGFTRQPVEYRHPLFDLRLIEYCLSLPPVPWCVNKAALRIAMRGELPAAVRIRPKTALAASPHAVYLRSPESAWVDAFKPSSLLESYVARAIIPAMHAGNGEGSSWVNLRPLSLNLWLDNLA